MARPITKLQDIEAAAVRLFAAHGVGRVTTKDIAGEAGCSEGALYRHYSSMDELGWKLFKREVEKFCVRLNNILNGNRSYGSRVNGSVSLFYEFFDKDKVTFTFILLSKHQFAFHHKIDPKLSPENLVFSFVRRGIQDGAFGIANASLGAAMVLGLVLMPATLSATGMLKGPISAHIRDTSYACLQVLQSTERRKRKKNDNKRASLKHR